MAIKPNYPVAAPIFCLNLHWNGEHNVHNSEWIRDLEREVRDYITHTYDTYLILVIH